MPNGVDVPGLPIPLPIPQVGPSFADVGEAIGGFFGRVFGGGGPEPFDVAFAKATELLLSIGPRESVERALRGEFRDLGAVASIIIGKFPDIVREIEFRFTGRPSIPTPELGGPQLVTERFQTLPMVPDVPELEEEMALDASLLAVGGVPARVGQAVAPSLLGFLGGIAQDITSGLFARAPQELGVGQIPMPTRRAPSQLAPGEKPSTRILRRIFENTGVRIKLSAAKALTRQLGLQAAANCLRVSVMDLCTLIITPSPRRRRGISGSDIRIVKRTARRFQALQEDLSGLGPRRRAAPRRKPRHVHALAHTAPGG